MNRNMFSGSLHFLGLFFLFRIFVSLEYCTVKQDGHLCFSWPMALRFGQDGLCHEREFVLERVAGKRQRRCPS